MAFIYLFIFVMRAFIYSLRSLHLRPPQKRLKAAKNGFVGVSPVLILKRHSFLGVPLQWSRQIGAVPQLFFVTDLVKELATRLENKVTEASEEPIYG